MEKLVIGLTGPKLAGKGTFVTILKNLHLAKTIEVVRSYDILHQTLTAWDLKSTRRNLQDLAIGMDRWFGRGTLSNAVRSKIVASSADVVIFDGVRWETDVEMIRSFPRSVLVYITADPRLRWERARERAQKPEEKNITLEQFLEEEKVPTETQISIIGQRAEVRIDNNNSDFESFSSRVRCFAERHIRAAS